MAGDRRDELGLGSRGREQPGCDAGMTIGAHLSGVPFLRDGSPKKALAFLGDCLPGKRTGDLRRSLSGRGFVPLFTDSVKTWEMKRDGADTRVVAALGSTSVRAQARFMELARERAKQSDPLARSGRFHILQVPQSMVEDGVRRVKSGKKKKHLQ